MNNHHSIKSTQGEGGRGEDAREEGAASTCTVGRPLLLLGWCIWTKMDEDDLTKACTTTQKRNEHVSHGILQFTSMAKWINITAPDLPEIRAQISLTATDTSMWCELDISQAASTLIILCCEKIETQARKPESYLCGCFVCRHPFGAVDMRP